MNSATQRLIDRLAALASRPVDAGPRWWQLPASVTQLLARAPLTQRGLALGALFATLAVFWPNPGASQATGTALWIAFLVGAGGALIGLPHALGWPEEVLSRVGAVFLGLGLIVLIVLTSFLQTDPVVIERVRLAAETGALLAVVLPLAIAMLSPPLARRLGPLAPPAWTVICVLAGAMLLVLGASHWLDLHSANPMLAAAFVLALGLWVAAFIANRIEAGRGLRWAGRLVAVRCSLVRLGGLCFGLAVAWRAVPRLEEAAWRAAFGTPLEGLAPVAGMLAGILVALTAAGAVLAAPGVLARRQLAGQVTAGAAGESLWAAAWLGLLTPPALAWAGYSAMVRDVGLGLPAILELTTTDVSIATTAVLAATLAVAMHAAVRLILGRPLAEAGHGLWLVLPGAEFSPAALATAIAAGRAWDAGPVTLVAPPGMAGRIRGPHLRLAQAAGALPELFAGSAEDAATWMRNLPDEFVRSCLPRRELYGAAPAARAMLAGLPASARVLVLADGPLAEGWADAVRQLPVHAQRAARTASALPGEARPFSASPGSAPWKTIDFGQASGRNTLLTAFLVDHRPRPGAPRRILIVHGDAARLLAERLAAKLDGQTDPSGASVTASTLAPPIGGQSLLRWWSAATWGSLCVIFFRLAMDGRLGAPAQRLVRGFFGIQTWASSLRLELLTLESGVQESGVAANGSNALRGLERYADQVIAVLPASRPDGAAPLYDATSYTGVLALPLLSVIDAALPGLAQQILAQAYGSPAALSPASASQAAPGDASALEPSSPEPSSTEPASAGAAAPDTAMPSPDMPAPEVSAVETPPAEASEPSAESSSESVSAAADLAPGPAIFLSDVPAYSSWRGMFEQALLERGLDVRSDRSLPPGDAWPEALAGMLDQCDVLVVLAGPDTEASENARREIEMARQRDMPIVPIFVVSFGVPAFLADFQAANRRLLANLSGEELLAEIAATADAIAKVAATATPPASSVPRKKGAAKPTSPR